MTDLGLVRLAVRLAGEVVEIEITKTRNTMPLSGKRPDLVAALAPPAVDELITQLQAIKERLDRLPRRPTKAELSKVFKPKG